jgi:uncharacterized integral membrane protein (TIGR00698 family)
LEFTMLKIPRVDDTRLPVLALQDLFPGLVLVTAIVILAFVMTGFPGLRVFSPVIFAVLIGAVVGNLFTLPAASMPGIKFSSRTLLRLAIVLLGLQIPVGSLLSIGWLPLLVILLAVAGTFFLTKAVAGPLGVDARLAELLAAGTAICGASAIMAVNTSTAADEEDVAYALATITVLGTVMMFAVPALSVLLGLDARAFSLWAGASIHEVGQVAGAAAVFGQGSEELSMVAKLARVLLLAPMVMLVGVTATRDRARRPAAEQGQKVPLVPPFVVGFFISVLIVSLVDIPADVLAHVRLISTALLTAALGALGVTISITRVVARGTRPFLLAVFSMACIGSIAFVGLRLIA